MLKAIGLQIRLNGEYFSDHQIMQRSDFQGITGMVRSTAMIHIRRLRQKASCRISAFPVNLFMCRPQDFMENPEIISLSNKLKQNKIPEGIPKITDIKKAAESMNLSFQGSLSAAISFLQAITENR